MPHSPAAPPSLVRLIQTAAIDHLARATALLSQAGPLEPTAIHETRKAVKRIRAALQLLRAGLPSQFSPWNARLREVHQALSIARDLDVCRQTLDELLPSVAKPSQATLECLRAEFEAQRSASSTQPDAAARPALMESLRRIQTELSEWSPEQTGYALIQAALVKLMKCARRLIRRLRDEARSEDLHSLRKLVKRRLYWLEALRPIWPRGLRAEEKLVDVLADQLGRHHDLEVLAERLRNSPVGQSASALRVVNRLNRRLRKRQEKLVIRALTLAECAFSERPKDFARRLKTLVTLWEASPPAVDAVKTEADLNGSTLRTRPR